MSFEDFKSNYSKVEICMLSPDSAGDLSAKRWEMRINQGTWQKHVSAGGCRNFPDTFHLNPQYRYIVSFILLPCIVMSTLMIIFTDF